MISLPVFLTTVVPFGRCTVVSCVNAGTARVPVAEADAAGAADAKSAAAAIAAAALATRA